MNADEKSDNGVVPQNSANKTAQAAAERREGRPSIKENIMKDQTVPAQNGAKHVSQGLQGVRRVAKERKQERFTTLLHHVTVDLLRESFASLKRQAAPGVDGVTYMARLARRWLPAARTLHPYPSQRFNATHPR